MEKLKALVAVTLFVAALLFAIGTGNTEKDKTQPKITQTILVRKR